MWSSKGPLPFASLLALCAFALVGLSAASVSSGPATDKGTQPGLRNALRPPGNCASCHGDYDATARVEPFNNWAGSMMANAGRDPLFWAALDVANNDLPGIGDFCLRCHSPVGWLEERSEPPLGSVDGCALEGTIDGTDKDFDGLTCHFCHRMMINLSPPAGEQPFYIENGQFWIDDAGCGGGGGQPCRRGPYDYPLDGADEPPHRWTYASYQEEGLICGNCHNVTNPIKNLIAGGVDMGIPYPIERTYREWVSSDYGETGSPFFLTCQNCHMPDASVDPAFACSAQNNNHTGDLPIHEFAGGNAWIPEVLRDEYPALNRTEEFNRNRDGALRLLQQESAVVELVAPTSAVEGGSLPLTVRVTNLTGHKLPTGYPEGRRMWIQVEVRDSANGLVYSSGAYDAATGELDHDPDLKLYAAEVGIWNYNGTNTCDIVDSGGSPMFHFVLNDCILMDNRIPPQGFRGGSDLEIRPVGAVYPETSPGSGILVNWDETDYSFTVPAGVSGPLSVTTRLYYQTTSKDYVEFLRDEAITNNFPDDCLENADGFPTSSRGELLYDMWTRHGRNAPVEMGSVSATVSIGGANCGNGSIEPGETCDPPATCPTACSDGNVCTADSLMGDSSTCDAACVYDPITVCADADGCCPTACDALNDTDCSASCGNGIVEPGETCDPSPTCPTDCNDGNNCTMDTLTGAAVNCNAACSHSAVTVCADADGCCPAGCNSLVDDDCSVSCGNGLIEAGETCDPPSSCIVDCNDGNSCTIDTLTGAAATCNAACSNSPISACADADGCCPAGCDAVSDDDCSPTCDNGVIEPGETCDPIASCPSSCDDGNSCTVDSLTGAAASCSASCSYSGISSCADADGCCPAGCDATADNDCSASCGNSVVEPGETCDPPASCPTDCNDGNNCTVDSLTGSAASCSAACSHNSISSCTGADGCCPAGCDAVADTDCSPSCDNGVIEPGETCDPIATCPTECNDGNDCTSDTLTGSAASCSAACSHNSISACANGDGCCPNGCDAVSDTDCSASCDNGVVEPGETCDPIATCPTDCSDGNACTLDLLTGSAAGCNAACSYNTVSSCADADGCCPAGCDAVSDDDCSPTCDNGVVEPGETCDPIATCPTACSDGNSCTLDSLTGSPASCSAACSYASISSCANGDGCCPNGCDATGDDDCSPSCGNGVVEPGETCDPPASCPTSCDDGAACTIDQLTGSAASCNAACAHNTISSCAHGDGCCPAGCDSLGDDDCSPSCGNGIIEPGETCDPQSSCPTFCDDGNACTIDTLSGNAASCSSTCSSNSISNCSSGDGCCPAGCTALSDDDCSASCGNGIIEPGETCDPIASCISDCSDGNACTLDTLTGAAASCNTACSHSTVSGCANDDGCCPPGCDSTSDTDCSPSCGNEVVEAGETCDPPSSCVSDCSDGNSCTLDTLSGSATSCNAGCVYNTISACAGGDGCCPAGCDAVTDSDCSASCDNGIVEPGETCDPRATCPVDCNDGNACTVDSLTGGAANCSAACSHSEVTTCANDDGCCPAGCDAGNDDDCSASCGNGVLEPGETCDPVASCPVSCVDGNACTVDTATGSAASCSAACSHNTVTACADADGCCPPGCNAAIDSDCSATCGNGTLEPGETCDPPESCPTDCDDGLACTLDSVTGAATNCSAACIHNPISSCVDGDGCCPAGCDYTADADCSATCGNGVLEPGETCDPPESCPANCDDADLCTSDTMVGSSTTCSVACSHTSISECGGNDGCCPPGCTAANDDACVQPVSPDPSPDSGCGCTAGDGGSGGGWALLLLWGLALRRRRMTLRS